jgi:transcriptional regulator with XRE-family HTH domain
MSKTTSPTTPNLKVERKLAGVSQIEVAARLGISRQTLNAWDLRALAGRLAPELLEKHRAAVAGRDVTTA